MSPSQEHTPPLNRLLAGVFLFLLAAVAAVAPLPILYRSLVILLSAYGAFSLSRMPFAYAIVLLTPPLGLITREESWLVMLPIIMSSGFLAMLGLEVAWRLSALVVSPLLAVTPPLFVWLMSRQRLFAVELPWQPSGPVWTLAHGLVALAGMIVAFWVTRRAEPE